jgi:hypothetical protein
VKAWGKWTEVDYDALLGCSSKSKSKGVMVSWCVDRLVLAGERRLLEMTSGLMALMEEMVVLMEQSTEFEGGMLGVCG